MTTNDWKSSGANYSDAWSESGGTQDKEMISTARRQSPFQEENGCYSIPMYKADCKHETKCIYASRDKDKWLCWDCFAGDDIEYATRVHKAEIQAHKLKRKELSNWQQLNSVRGTYDTKEKREARGKLLSDGAVEAIETVILAEQKD